MSVHGIMMAMEPRGKKMNNNEIIKQLESINNKIDKLIKSLDNKDDINPSTKCIKCGMTFEGATSYWCPEPMCPIFTKTTL